MHTIRTATHRRLVALIIAERKARGLSQAEVGARLGKTQSFVSFFERGERRLDVVEFLRFARAIGFSPIKIIGKLARFRE